MSEAIVTPFFRLAFPAVFVAKPTNKNKPDSPKKFGIQMIFIDQKPLYAGREDIIIAPAGTAADALTPMQKDYAKDPTLLIQIRRLLADACKEKWGEDKAKWPMPFKGYELSTYVSEDGKKFPIRNGDMVSWDGFAGHLFASAKANEDRKPGCVDSFKNHITDPSKVRGGRICRAQINAFCWHNSEGGHGVSLGLNHLQVIKDDGTRYGGSAGPVEDAFGAWDDGSMDAAPAAGSTGAVSTDEF